MNPIDTSSNAKPPLSGSEQRTGAAQQSSQSQATGRAASTPRDTTADAVTITRAATELLQLEDQLAALPEADLERVEAIRSAISNGSYQIDAERIVNNLLQAERDLYPL